MGHVKGAPAWNKGMSLTKEAIQKRTATRRKNGWFRNPSDFSRKQSEARRGKIPKNIQALLDSNVGIKHSLERVEKMRISHTGKKYPNRKRPIFTEEHKAKILKHLSEMPRRETSIERMVEAELIRLGIPFRKQVPLLGKTVVDFLIGDVAVYADGDYWHNLPSYKNRDEKINRALTDAGYKVFRFWEHDIKRSVEACIGSIGF